MKFTTMLRAHRAAKKVLMFWGSSGFGKTATVKAYVKEDGMNLILRNAVYLDPLNAWIPRDDDGGEYIIDKPHKWVHEVLTTEKPTVLFLDELTRCRSVQIMNMLTELILERTFNGFPISEHVQIVCATNLYDEDNGLVEVPDAVMNRMTHIVFAPETAEAATNMRTQLGRDIILRHSKLLRVPGTPELKLDANPRQIDEIVDLWMTGVLTETDLQLVCRGRCGAEKGAVIAADILDEMKKKDKKLPSVLAPSNFAQAAKCDAEGMGIEVVNLLKATLEMGKSKKQEAQAQRLVADYLVQYATPETCRAMQSAKFYFKYPDGHLPTEADGSPIVNKYDDRKLAAGMPHVYYLVAKMKLSDGFVEPQETKK